MTENITPSDDVFSKALPLFKPYTWNRSGVVTAHLADTKHAPVLTFCIDLGTSVALVSQAQIGADSGEQQLMKHALQNLEAKLTEQQWQMFSAETSHGPCPVAAFTGHFFSAEGILVADIMTKAHQLLNESILAVITPKRGMMLAIGLSEDNPSPASTAMLRALASMAIENHFENPQEAITPCVWAVRNGEIMGAKAPEQSTIDSWFANRH